MTATEQIEMLRSTRTLVPAAETHGEIFTRRWVVDLILDLVGYTPDRDLQSLTILEPSCGRGAFLGPIVERLIESSRRHGHSLTSATEAIRAFDLLAPNAELASKSAMSLMLDAGETIEVAEALSAVWVKTGDFLLTDHQFTADFVVGNPPYVRLEDMTTAASDAYRERCQTMRGRSDIYVGFFEQALSLLSPEGRLGFICADRWMHNQYGAGLREFVSTDFSVDAIIGMHDVDAFEAPVSAYPAITIIRNGEQGRTRLIETNARFGPADAVPAFRWIAEGKRGRKRAAFSAGELAHWFAGPTLWPSGPPANLELLANLESRFAPLEDPKTGTRVGIGVATGCDDVFIVTSSAPIEDDRLLPLAMASDLSGGSLSDTTRYLVNPWGGEGLVNLDEFPKLAAYVKKHKRRIKARYVAQKRPDSWYRTIDRVTAGLADRPKLLMPDMKAAAHPVLDTGGRYPHHNLYYVVSDEWDLEVLGGLLLSDVTNLFVGAFCVKMRGGTFRFQAQYLRKIRVPEPDSIAPKVAKALRTAFRNRDTEAATNAAEMAYGLPAGSVPRHLDVGSAPLPLR